MISSHIPKFWVISLFVGKLVIIQRAVQALVFELVAPPLEQIYTKPKQLGFVLENPY